MKSLLFLVVVFLISLSAAHALHPCNCEPDCAHNKTQPTDVVVNTLTYSPNPPVKGQDIKLSATATSKVKLDTNSKVTVDIFFMGIKIDSMDLPFDSTTTIPFPVQSGDFSYTAGIQIPSVAPPGDYTIDALFQDNGGVDRGCEEVKIHLS